MKHQTLTAILLATALPFAPLTAVAQQGIPGAHFIENWDLDQGGQVTLAEAEQKRDDLFYMFDQDENGFLDKAEYDLFDETRAADIQANERGLGRGPMKVSAEGLTRDFNDVDGDGLVSKAEFIERTADGFQMMDLDGDGAITTGDFSRRG